MFYNIFTKLCNENGMSPTAALQKMSISTSKLTAWKNGSSPNGNILILISEFFSVSIDYLLTGKDRTPKEKNEEIHQTDGREQELLRNFRLLPDNQKDQLIGRVQLMAEQAAETRKAV